MRWVRGTRRVRHAVSLVAVTAIVASACSSGSGSNSEDATSSPGTASSSATDGAATPKASGDACSVVSDDVVKQVLSAEIARREPTGTRADSSFSCIKGVAASDDPNNFTQVSVAVDTGAGAPLYESYITTASTPVAGVGDRAAFLSNSGTLFVLNSSDLLTIKVAKAGANGNQQDTVAVAKDVLTNLG